VTFNAATNPSLASLVAGASVSVSAGFTVPPPPAKASGGSDTDYFASLGALEGAQLTASASASGITGAVLVAAPPPPPVVTIEHLPIVSLAKSGPSSVGAGSVETNPLTLTNGGGASAEGLSVVDTVAGSVLTVPSAPTTLAPGESATTTATYSVPSAQPWGGLADTASVTWQDLNGNSYGPVSSSFTTRVTPAYGASPSGLFGVIPGLEVVVGVDPATGAVNTLADISSPDLVFGSNLAADPGTHRLFEAEMVGQTARLLTIDTTSGTVSITALPHPIVGLAFDPTSSSLYAVTLESQRHIVRVDLATGAETNLADFFGDTFTPTALDPASHTFYAISQAPAPTTCCAFVTSQLFSLDISTNTLTTGPVLVTPVLGLAFDTSGGTLFAVTGCCPSQLVRLNPSSGVETPVGGTDLGQVCCEMGVDPSSHTIFVTQYLGGDPLDTRILEVDDQTGNVVSGPPLGGEVRALVFEP